MIVILFGFGLFGMYIFIFVFGKKIKDRFYKYLGVFGYNFLFKVIFIIFR